LVSGYAVPALRATADGELCVAGRCERFRAAQAYHDHNWGVWRDVQWEWGSARAGAYTLLYGRVHRGGADDVREPLFVYLVDSLGFRAIFRPATIRYEDGGIRVVDGRTIRIPARAVMADVRGADTLRIGLEIEDAMASDVRRAPAARGDAARPLLVQMKGVARLGGRLGGVPLVGEGRGFFETYR
ncbi:MAG: hypothetical protein ACKOH8_04445, partial [Gemmatimonadota bacterium]